MNIKHTILLLSIVSLVACSENLEDNQKPNGKVEDLVPVEFSISDQRTIDFTRAATSIITFNAGETVKVYVKPDGAGSHVGYDYTTATAGQSVSLTPPAPPAIPPYYPPGVGTTVEAYAYYPSTASGTFTVQDDQTSDANYKASDLMYADNRVVTKDGTDGHDHLSMAHQMAQLAITAQAQDGSDINITGVQVIAQKSVTFAPNTANIVTTTGATGTITVLNGAGTGYIVIPPQVINGVIIKIITGSGTDDEIATYAFTGTGSFNSGDSYALNLTVSADQLGFTTAINNWNGVGSVNVIPAGNYTISAIPAQEYTGSAITPSFTVKKGEETVDPSLYDVTWVNNVNAGKAYIIVTGTGTQEGAVGMTSFTITPANGKIEYAVTAVTKKYGNEPFINPLTNKDTRDGHEGQEADGPVSYVSSDPTVATVDAETGQVTLLKAGSTRISATATNGANYVYSTSAGDHTAYYDLTVNQGDGIISFDFAAPSQTWSPTAANNKYTQTATKTGDGVVTYAIGSTNTCGATIDSGTGEVLFTQSGSVEVRATITNTECYTYAVNTASYTLTVNKTTGFITLSETSGSIDAGGTKTFSVSTNHGGTLSVADVSGNNRSTPSISGTTVTVATNGVAASSATIRVTCAATDCYLEAYADYELTIIAAVDIKKNPLYYVAERNLASNGTFENSDNAGYYFTWTDAMNYAAQSTSYNTYKVAKKGPNSEWHLPIEKEWFSIVPGQNNVNIWDFDSGSGTLKNAYIVPVWGYSNTTKNGVTETSYWKKEGTTVMTAIRFLGTEYCSAWRYELIGNFTSSSYGYMRVSATLIGEVDPSDAAEWYANYFGGVTWGNNNSAGAAQRIIYARGYRVQGNGSGSSPQMYQGEYGYGWSATEASSAVAWAMVFCGGSTYGWHAQIHSSSFTKSYAWAVRLFRDN